MNSTESRSEVATVQFGRLERRGVLLGLSAAQLALGGAAVVVVVVAVRGAGGLGFAVAAPLWVFLLAAALVSVRGRSIPAWAPVAVSWIAGRATGRARAASVRPAAAPESLVLPGVAEHMDLVPCPPLGGVLVVDRRAGTVTAVARVHGRGLLLDDGDARAHRAGAWGRVLAGLASQPSVVRVQVLTVVVPGGLSGARRWWREHCTTDAVGPAAALADLLDAGFARTSRREHLVAIAVRSPRGHRRVTPDGATAVGGVFESLAQAMAGAELVVDEWLDRDGLADALRRAYDPRTAALAEDVPAKGFGPAGVAEEWDRLRTGTAWHATYWIAEWPRTPVGATFLQPLLLGEVGTRTLSVIAEAVPAREALREIRRARAEHLADAEQRARIGQVEGRAVAAEVEDLDRREAELVAGHSDLRFTGLITVSAPDRAALDDTCRAVEGDAALSMCDLVRLVGQQGAGHLAATVPLARSVR